eukprot:jgi/Ulvmu1/10584/UM065_0038.1
MAVSDDDVRSKLRELLPDVDLQTATERHLREKLQERFGCNLKDRKHIFKEEIQDFLSSHALTENDAEVDPDEEAPKITKKRKTGLAAACTLSPEMQQFLGVDEEARMSRPEVVKAVWAYVKANDLQDPKDRRKFLKDPKLELIFKFPVTMFTLNKQLSRHVKPSADVLHADAGAEQPPRAKKAKKAATASKKSNSDEGKPKKVSAFTKPLKLSSDLSAVVGTTQASRGECQKLLWAYIKDRGLQSQQNKSTILVHKDELLHKVLKVNQCTGFGMSTHLKGHFLGPAD